MENENISSDGKILVVFTQKTFELIVSYLNAMRTIQSLPLQTCADICELLLSLPKEIEECSKIMEEILKKSGGDSNE